MAGQAILGGQFVVAATIPPTAISAVGAVLLRHNGTILLHDV